MRIDHLTNRFFETVARAIYSHGLVTAVMLFVITYMTLFSHTLFLQILPAAMSPWERDVSAWLMAIGWDLTLLVTMGNPRHIHRSIPWIGATASGIIVLFFFDAFQGMITAATLLMIQRWFTGLLAAIIAFIYTSLFHAKWSERNELAALPSKLHDTERRLIQAQTELDEVKAKYKLSDATLNEVRSKLKEREQKTNDLLTQLDQHLKELTCPHCKVVQANPRSLNAHKGHCASNPKNKHLNGTSLKQIV